VEGHEEDLFALKDFWPERSRRPEAAFYKRIKKNLLIEGRESFGLAGCVGSLDLGVVEEQVLGHRTLSASLVQNEVLKRTHSRFLTSPVGYDIELFTSTRNLIEAWRDAIKGILLCFPFCTHLNITQVTAPLTLEAFCIAILALET
jgi:hypothetical protein